MASDGYTTESRVASDAERDHISGWLVFAGTVLGVAGIMRIFDAVWAFSYNGPLPDQLKDGLVGEKLDNYAWMWLVVAAILILSSFLILWRSQIGRWIGIVAAAITAITAMTWMPYYPIWALIYVVLAVLVIYALARYDGRETA